MATTTGLLSWEAFEQLPDDDMHHELIEGELQTLPPPRSKHGYVANNVNIALRPLEQFGRVFVEVGYKLTSDPASWIQPDVSFSRRENLRAEPDGHFLGAPELAVEVVSPSETACDLDRKIELFLRFGTLVVWVIYRKRGRSMFICPTEPC